MDYVALACVGLLCGVVFVSFCQIIDLVRHRWLGRLTTGRVIQLEEHESNEGGPVFIPIVEYRVGEQSWRIKSLIAMAPALYQAGQEVPVYYFEASPESGRVVTAREFFKWIVGGGSCGLLLWMLVAGRGGAVTPAP
jgi:Protein of unknown function (DUF3592).